MANYQGLNSIMGEITTLAAASQPPHDQHIYDFFELMELFIKTVVPQLIGDYLEHFQTALTVEFKTYLNGKNINHNDITTAVADILQKAIGKARIKIEI